MTDNSIATLSCEDNLTVECYETDEEVKIETYIVEVSDDEEEDYPDTDSEYEEDDDDYFWPTDEQVALWNNEAAEWRNPDAYWSTGEI